MGKGSEKQQQQQLKGGQPFRSTAVPATLAKERSLTTKWDRILLPIVTVVACVVRYWKIWEPHSVVFDEVHFGGFARKYIIGRFFMDVHPPLAKMLYAVVGFGAGYDGEFDFKTIGLDYLVNNVPYVALRAFPATLGILTVMLAYATLRASGCRPLIAAFGAALVTVDNALVTQSRYILLDAPLLFFIAITAYSFKKFENEVPFTVDWFRYLFLTGLGLGATVSSKWVGLFTIGWVGLLTLYQLWWLIGDLSVTPKAFSKHFLFRAVLLIGVPIAFYVGMFALHFICLVNDGDGASFMSPEFQATLQHTKLNANVPADVAFGSEVVIRHLNTQGGYLHSHEHMYETGSKQQQITLYPHKDDNNIWVIENITAPAVGEEFDKVAPRFIEDGTIVRLRHKHTSRRLHSHDHRPPVSEQEHQNEVSAYGYEGFEGDANDNFRVEIIEKKSDKGVARERVRTLQTKFRLVHTLTGCTLFSHNVKLPKWAFEQQEVTCIKGGTLPNSIWYIEDNFHPMFDETTERVNYRVPSFLEKFVELNKVMWQVNAGLTETHTWESRPDSWPIMKRGINFWVKDHRQVYLIGNGPVWWATTALIVAYVVHKGIWLLRWQRGYQDLKNDGAWSLFDSGFGSYLLGWALHYFPSYLMARQLFLHHYLASAYFGTLALAQFWQFFTTRVIKNKAVSTVTTILFFTTAAGWFAWYSPLAYGDKWTKGLCEKSKFLDMDFDCNSFFETLDEYKTYTPQVERPQGYEEPAQAVEPAEEIVTVSEIATEPESAQQQEEPAIEEPAVEVPVPEAPLEESETPGVVRGDGQVHQSSKQVDVVEEEENTEAYPVNNGIISETPDQPAKILTVSGERVSTQLLKKEQKVEYRDAQGNVLDPLEVEKLVKEGKIEIQTVHESKERFLDQNGNEVDPKDIEGLLA